MQSNSHPTPTPMIHAVIIVLIAAFFRFHLLSADLRFHPDEAYFAAFARNAAVRGEWLLPGNLDKPPLSIYGQAAMMLMLGNQWDGAVWRLDVRQGEFAARMWSAYAGVLLVALMFPLARYIIRERRAALLAALLVALSPYAVAFGATAFTDVPMVLFVTLALMMSLRGLGGWAALCLVLAYASKQQALFFVLLVAVLMILTARRVRSWVAFVVVIASGLALLVWWDAARPFPPVFALAAANNAPERWLAPPADWLPRLAAWLALSRWLFGPGAVTLIVFVGGVFGLTRGKITRIQCIVIAFVILYALLHWLVPLNIYDRYVLPLLPLLAVLVALGWVRLLAMIRPFWPYLIAVLLLVGMIVAAWDAATGHRHIGGDRGQHAGIIELADYINSREFGAIVYDRWLGWELNYYLGAWSDKRRAYYPTPEDMTSDPAIYVPDVAPRYFPVPAWVDASAWLAALRQAGFDLCVGYDDERFRVLVLTLPAEGLRPSGVPSSELASPVESCPS